MIYSAVALVVVPPEQVAQTHFPEQLLPFGLLLFLQRFLKVSDQIRNGLALAKDGE
jgi:hypothetical protein